ncbi:ABC transporter permease [Nitratifractor sp.]|uniref:ABC transporter permease n=1 Tax=Nitratifractor sp. TaxID=2268144 RepID=UPI0025EFAB24|nr:ABC transporter permease [Nitratifractor sp.]
MIRSMPRSLGYRIGYALFVILFYLFLFAPLIVISVLAFNDSQFVSLPWNGFTLDWFFANGPDRIGLFHDPELLRSLWISIETGLIVAALSLVVGTMGAFLFVQERFCCKEPLYFLAIAPLVIPGVILGISILLTATMVGDWVEKSTGIDLEFLRPSFWLVVLGQFSFIATFVLLVVISRLKKFDHTLEEAAMDLGANRWTVIRRITIPFLMPALIGSFVVAFLMSFGNFNTTLFLVGSDATLPIELYTQIRDGSTPVLNAVSFLLIVFTSSLALLYLLLSKKE